MKAKLNIITIATPALIVGITFFIATIKEAGTDTKHYIEFARYTNLYMNGIETFWGYPGEYTLTILNRLSGIIASITLGISDPSTILALAKITAILIGFAFILINYKDKTKAWTRASSIFLILYFTSDIFMLGFLNSLRTGLGIFFISLFLSSQVGNISASLEIGDSLLPAKHDTRLAKFASALILALAMTSHNSIIMVILIYIFSSVFMQTIERNQGWFKYSSHSRLYIVIFMFCSFSMSFIGGRIVELRSMGQESASGIAGLKLFFDALILLLLIIRYMPGIFICSKTRKGAKNMTRINSGAAFLFISASSLLGLCISTYGSETSNRIEQLLRITVYAIASIAASKKIAKLKKDDWILLCILLISGLGILNFSSPAVQMNLV